MARIIHLGLSPYQNLTSVLGPGFSIRDMEEIIMSKTKTKTSKKKVTPLAIGEGKRKAGPIMGVDVHKSVLAYCIVTEANILEEGTRMNTKAGIKKLVATFKKHKVRSVAMESTAQYHLKLAFSFIDEGFDVLVANPQQTKETQGKKTDKLDARRIAIAHRDGRLKPSVISPREIMSLRKATRARVRKTEEMTQTKQRLQQMFHHHDADLGDLLKKKWGRNVLLRLFQDDIDELLDAYLAKQSEKKRDTLKKQLVQFKRSMGEIDQEVFRIEMEQLIVLDIQADQLRMVYVHHVRDNEEFAKLMKLLLTIPGVGPDTAAVVIAEMVNVSFFASPKKLAKWAGLVPRVYQSGHRKKVTGKLHKGGNKHLRRALTLACANIYAKGHVDNPLYKHGRRLKEEKGYWLAICAMARRLLVAIWYMWQNMEEWRPHDAPDSLFTHVFKVVKAKQAMLERQAKRYKQLSGKLIRAFVQGADRAVMKGGGYRMSDPRQIVKALLESV